MPKRSSYEIKKKILHIVREKPASYAELERKVNTGYRTIKSNCKELESFENIKIEKIPEHFANGRPYNLVSITKRGREFLERENPRS